MEEWRCLHDRFKNAGPVGYAGLLLIERVLGRNGQMNDKEKDLSELIKISLTQMISDFESIEISLRSCPIGKGIDQTHDEILIEKCAAWLGKLLKASQPDKLRLQSDLKSQRTPFK